MKAILSNGAVILLSLFAGLLLCELALRALGFSYPMFGYADAYTGNRLRPNAQGWYKDEGEAFIRISSAGLRDREHEPRKPANTVRIAVLGDSFVEALQVPLEQTFWHLLQEKLGACRAFGDAQVEVINFGVSGYGTGEELLTLRNRVWDYAPDVVLLAFLTGNDIRDNSKVLSGNFPRPYFNRELQLDDSFLDNPAYKLRQRGIWQAFIWASDHLRLAQLANKVKYLVGQRLLRRGSPPRTQNEIGLEDAVYLSPQTPAWLEAWEITERLVSAISQEVRGKGASLFVATLSNGIQVHPDPQVRAHFMEKLAVKELFYPDRRIEALTEKLDIDHIILAPKLQAIAETNRIFLHGFANNGLGQGHWNENGHRFAAQLIADEFCRGHRDRTLAHQPQTSSFLGR